MWVRGWLYRAGNLCYVQSEGEARERIPLFPPGEVSSPTIKYHKLRTYRAICVTVLGVERFISFDPIVILRDNDVPLRIRRSCLHDIPRCRNNPLDHPKLWIRRRSIINLPYIRFVTLIRRCPLFGVWIKTCTEWPNPACHNSYPD